MDNEYKLVTSLMCMFSLYDPFHLSCQNLDCKPSSGIHTPHASLVMRPRRCHRTLCLIEEKAGR